MDDKIMSDGFLGNCLLSCPDYVGSGCSQAKETGILNLETLMPASRDAGFFVSSIRGE